MSLSVPALERLWLRRRCACGGDAAVTVFEE